MKDWPAFATHRSHLIAEIIERKKTDLPCDFFPWAPGIVVASDYLLQATGYRFGSLGPSGWTPGQPDVFTKVMYGNRLMVRGCGKFWTVERENYEALAFLFGPMPMFTSTRQAAMRLAEYCHPKPRKGEGAFPDTRVRSLRWAVSEPSGIRFCNYSPAY